MAKRCIISRTLNENLIELEDRAKTDKEKLICKMLNLWADEKFIFEGNRKFDRAKNRGIQVVSGQRVIDIDYNAKIATCQSRSGKIYSAMITDEVAIERLEVGDDVHVDFGYDTDEINGFRYAGIVRIWKNWE
jgi:hypothetical protein